MGITFNQGLQRQLQALIQPEFPLGGVNVALAAPTVPTWVGDETFSASLIAVIAGTTMGLLGITALEITSDSAGSAVAILNEAVFSCASNPDTVTINQWFIAGGSPEQLLWGGSVSPPWTPNISVGGTLTLADISITGPCVIPPPPPPGPTVYLYDTFSDSNGTPLVDHVMNIGPGWSITNSSFEIQSNSAVDSIETSQGVVAANAGVANATMSCALTNPSDGGLVFRLLDDENYLLVRIASSEVDVYSCVANSFTELLTITYSWTGSHTIGFVAEGSSVEVYIDGAFEIPSPSQRLRAHAGV